MSLGPAIGPSLGGYLIDHLSWRAVVLYQLPHRSRGLSGSSTHLTGRRRTSTSLPRSLGLLTLTTFVVTLLVAVSETRTYGWMSPYVLGLLPRL